MPEQGSSVHAVKETPPMPPGLRALLEVADLFERHVEPPKRPALKLLQGGRDSA